MDDDLYGLNAYLGYIQQVTGIRFAIYGFADLTQLEQALHDGKIDLLYGIPQSEALHGTAISALLRQQPARIARSQQRSAGDAQLRQRPRRDRRADRHAVRRRSAGRGVADPALRQQSAGGLLAAQRQRLLYRRQASASFIIDQLQLGQLYQIESNENLGNLSFVFAAADSRLIDTLDTAIADAPMELMNALQSRWSKRSPATSTPAMPT